MPKEQHAFNGKKPEGKSPLGRASRENLSPEFTAQHIEKTPKSSRLSAFTAALAPMASSFLTWTPTSGRLKKSGARTLKSAPRITSPKENAAKFLFVVPEEDRLKVSDQSRWLLGRKVGRFFGAGRAFCLVLTRRAVSTPLRATCECIPPLLNGFWSGCGSSTEAQSEGLWTTANFAIAATPMRSREEKIEIARSCLSVIEPRGANSEQFWWEIGAMIHSELPNEDGLKLWEEWSRRDNEYADDWKNGNNPCAERWENGFPWRRPWVWQLIRQADQVDPNKTRFQGDGLASTGGRDRIDADQIQGRLPLGRGTYRQGARVGGDHREPCAYSIRPRRAGC